MRILICFAAIPNHSSLCAAALTCLASSSSPNMMAPRQAFELRVRTTAGGRPPPPLVSPRWCR